MPTHLPPYAAALARLRPDPRDRTTTLVLRETYGHTTATVPSARRLAHVLVLPVLAHARPEEEHLRRDGRLAARPAGSQAEPSPVDVETVVDLVAQAVATLPRLERESDVYAALRRLGELDPAQARDVVRRAVGATASAVERYRPPRPDKPRRSALTDAQRKAAQRARDRVAEAESVAAFLADYFDDEEAPRPGERVVAGDLYAAAVEWIGAAVEERREAEEYIESYAELWDSFHGAMDLYRLGAREVAPAEPRLHEPETWEEIAEDEGYPLHPRIPTRQRFYALADEVLGERRRVNGARFYTVPEHPRLERLTNPEPPAEPEEADPMDTATAMLFDRTAEILADRHEERLARLRSGDYAGALTMQREDLSATGTDGAVVDLAAARSRRATTS